MQSNRREFLIEAAAAAAALGLAARNAGAQTGAGPNDRINMGFIGLGGMGSGRLAGFMEHPDVNVTALCDVDESHLRNAAGMVEKKRGKSPATFHDFRKLLDQKDVDAVCVATPDHWHALPTILACKAGKDVFCEKPLCYSIGEGRAMVAAAAANKRITQLGNHIHNDYPNYRRAVELVRSGVLGKIDRVSCWMQSSRKGMGRPPDGPPPKELDYDFWLGPAPKRPYNPNRSHGTFRYFWDYSGGIFADFWCHITDVAYWALDLKGPTSVVTLGNRNLDDNGETPNQMEVVYEYAEGPMMTWTVGPNGFPGFEDHYIGCLFQGSEGTLRVDYTTHELFVKGKPVTDFARPPQSITDSPGHLREFLDSIKSRKLTTCNVEYAHRLTKGALLGNIAYRTGRRIRWDDATEHVVSDSAAQQLVTRRYRKPWRLA
ncbi:MAG TPA: Gfo/Idh/MocA family oxidoreductase [Bryobacteraceae bacterium]